MGLFKKFHQLHQAWSRSRQTHSSPVRRVRPARACRFEQMEPRQLLTADPIHLGVVYTEGGGQDDSIPDRFEIRFTGGATGTQLTHLEINTATSNDGVFFDTAAGGEGVYGHAAARLLETNGLTILGSTQNNDGSVTYTCSGFVSQVTISVSDGGTSLVIDAVGLEADETLVISIDVDEWVGSGASSLAEAAELENSTLTATFTATGYYDATSAGSDVFIDAYNSSTALAIGLPADADDLTGAGFIQLSQTTRPTLSGTVFEDTNGDNDQDSGELGIAGVTVTLLKWNSTTHTYEVYSTTETDANGDYRFINLDAGTYQVKEGAASYTVNGTTYTYLDVGAALGTIDGVSATGTVSNKNTLTGITLVGGDDCVENNFAESRPATLSGYVYVDADNDAVLDSTESRIPGTLITVTGTTNTGESITRSTTTADDGSWSITNLLPGTYTAVESQPSNYLDGRDRQAGDTADSPTNDRYSSITLVSYQSDVGYNFGERLAQLSGHVYVDTDNDGVFDSNEVGIGGVTITITGTSADGTAVSYSAITSADGSWSAEVCLGTYTVVESQPVLYLDGKDTAGSVGGTVSNDQISSVTLSAATLGTSLEATNYNFGERLVTLSGHVYVDTDNDGVFDSGESGISGVTIRVTGTTAAGTSVSYTDVTVGANGYWEIAGLYAGTYTVTEDNTSPVLANYVDGKDTVGSAGGTKGNDVLSAINLTSGNPALSGTNQATDYNFGERLPATISGIVYHDVNKDGDYDAGTDQLLSGVLVVLGDASGVELQRTYTDANGFYSFSVRESGVYTILESQPTGYEDSVDFPGSKGGVAVNRGETIDPQVLSVLAIDPKDDAIINIKLSLGDNGVHYNFSEVLTTNPPDPPPHSDPPIPEIVFPNIPVYLGEAVAYNPPVAALAPDPVQPLIYSGGAAPPVGNTWHLSVINGGQPRGLQDGLELTQEAYVRFSVVSWANSMGDGEWIIADSNGKPIRKLKFGVRGARPVVGDWNGDGKADVGVYLVGQWYLDVTGDGVWNDGDLWARIGQQENREDQPVTGDWDGDGKTDIGIFGPSWPGDERAIEAEPGQPDPQNVPQGVFKNIPPDRQNAASEFRTMKNAANGRVRADVIDHVYRFGNEGDKAVAGDWNGGGVATTGVFREGKWYLDSDGNGKWNEGDLFVKFGRPGDIPVVGDWNDDGIDDLGVFRRGTFYLDSNGNHELDAQDKVFQLGGPNDLPAAGDFDGDGIDDVAVYHDTADTAGSPQAALPPDDAPTGE